MTRAVRSPGSTLKPFIYGLAFEAGLAHPETLIEDRPTRFGLYVPKNFDQDCHGTVTDPHGAHAVAQHAGGEGAGGGGPAASCIAPPRSRSASTPVLPKGAEPSLAIALGGLGLRLADLATLYAGLARGGEPVALRYRRDGAAPQGRGRRPARCCRRWPPGTSPTSCATRRRRPTPSPGSIAYKTGTSYGFRDAWAVGYDGRHTIAVWVGRPDGAATPGLAGRTAAAPLLFDAFARLSPRRARRSPPAPSGALRVAGTDLPPPLKRFREAQRRDRRRRLPGARGADRLPARPLRARGRGRRGASVVRQGRGRRPAADLAGRRRADRLRSRPPRGRAAGRRAAASSSSR